jgi:superfamily II DNA or RNA helicase
MSCENYLSKKGYVIHKSNISSDDLIDLKLTLRAKPLVDNKFNFQTTNPYFPVYIETKNKLYIPKMFGIEKFGFPKNVLENYEGKEWENEIEFNGTLLDNQIEPVNMLIKACKEKGGGILEAGTGTGKSVMALNILSKLKGKTLIVVNKIPLMNQWVSECKTFLSNAKVDIIQGQKKIADTESCDIVIIMLQSMSRIDYPDSLFKHINVVIFDEVHNTSSLMFSQIFFKLTSKYTIGLSATPKRADGCEYVFKWHIGDIVYKSDIKRKGKPPIIRSLKINTKEYKEISIVNNYTGLKQIQFTSMLTELIKMSKRNLLVVELLKNLTLENRKILVIGDRREHLETINNLLNNDNNITFTYGLFLGQKSKKDEKRNEQSRNCTVILATSKAFGEGISERDLDTLILITPKKYVDESKEKNKDAKKDGGKLNQLVGRVFRKDHIERNPIIIDFFDNFSVYKHQFTTRKVFYKQHFKNGIFEDQSIDLDEHQDVKTSYIKTKKSKQSDEEVEGAEGITKFITNCVIDD